MNQVILT